MALSSDQNDDYDVYVNPPSDYVNPPSDYVNKKNLIMSMNCIEHCLPLTPLEIVKRNLIMKKKTKVS